MYNADMHQCDINIWIASVAIATDAIQLLLLHCWYMVQPVYVAIATYIVCTMYQQCSIRTVLMNSMHVRM